MGSYRLQFDLDLITGMVSDGTENFTADTILLTDDTAQKKNRTRYLFNITHPGTLYLETTGSHDVRATLYGPGWDILVCRAMTIAGRAGTSVSSHPSQPGLYMLEVERQTNAAVTYTLSANFARGVTIDDPTDTGDTPPVDDTDDMDDMDDTDDPGTVTRPIGTDSRGSLGDPPNNGVRSGIGIIRGWVCQADRVRIQILMKKESKWHPFTAGYGTDRPDTLNECAPGRTNTGFGDDV